MCSNILNCFPIQYRGNEMQGVNDYRIRVWQFHFTLCGSARGTGGRALEVVRTLIRDGKFDLHLI